MKKIYIVSSFLLIASIFCNTAFAKDYSMDMTLKDVKVRKGTPNCEPAENFSIEAKIGKIGANKRFKRIKLITNSGEKRVRTKILKRGKKTILRSKNLKLDGSNYKLRVVLRGKKLKNFLVNERKEKTDNAGNLHMCVFKYSLA